MYQSEADRENKARERLKRLVERGGTLPAWMKCDTTPTVFLDKTDDSTTEVDSVKETQN